MSETSSLDYSKPTRECDIVMEGGISSGIVYPATVSRLAETYKFVNIGGTSAGAIAAAATAPAEYSRSKGSTSGFEKLAKLPGILGSKPAGSKPPNVFIFFNQTLEFKCFFA